jgi:hypothetical protein
MLTLDVSEALAAHLASLHGAIVVTPDDAPAVAARAMLSALARAVPALRGSPRNSRCAPTASASPCRRPRGR